MSLRTPGLAHHCKGAAAAFLALPLQPWHPPWSILGITGFVVCHVAFHPGLGMSSCLACVCSWTWRQHLTALPRMALHPWSQEILLPPKCLNDRCVPPRWLESRFDQRQGSEVLATSNSGDTNVLSVKSPWTVSNSGAVHEDTVTLRTWLCSQHQALCKHV